MKNIFLFSIIIFLVPYAGEAANNTPREKLQTADSLYAQEQYMNALKQYNSLLNKHRFYTPAMLLKMAYIHEGLEDFAMSLYYLEMYLRNTADWEVVDKINKLANAHNLSGYEYTAKDYMTIFIKTHQEKILILLTLICAIIIVITSLRYRKGHKIAFGNVLWLFIAALLALGVSNIDQWQNAIITQQPYNYIMAGPSAGAEVMDVLQAGHKLNGGSEKDVWVKVNWNNIEGYVKKSQIKKVSF